MNLKIIKTLTPLNSYLARVIFEKGEIINASLYTIIERQNMIYFQ